MTPHLGPNGHNRTRRVLRSVLTVMGQLIIGIIVFYVAPLVAPIVGALLAPLFGAGLLATPATMVFIIPVVMIL